MSDRLKRLKTKDKERPKQNGGQNKHIPEKEDYVKVATMCVMGIPHAKIAKHMNIAVDTLKKNFSYELEHAKEDKNMQIVNALFQKAIKGDTTALIFWCKTQLGWKENNLQDLVIPQIILRAVDASKPT